jgi:hypothetical protein
MYSLKFSLQPLESLCSNRVLLGYFLYFFIGKRVLIGTVFELFSLSINRRAEIGGLIVRMRRSTAGLKPAGRELAEFLYAKYSV